MLVVSTKNSDIFEGQHLECVLEDEESRYFFYDLNRVLENNLTIAITLT